MAWSRSGLLIVACAGCVNPASDRADRDFDGAGRLLDGARTITIEPGIATRDAGGAIVLRASAPDFTIEITGTGDVALAIENIQAEVVLAGAAQAPTATTRTLTVTAPATIVATAPAMVRPVHFAFFSDVHANVDSARALTAAINADPSIDFVISGGDLVDTGSDVGEWEAVMPIFAGLTAPLYGTNGNHELNGGDGEQHHLRFGRMNTAFTFHGTRMIAIDSGSGTIARRVLDWLDGVLANPTPITIFVTHVPPRDPDGIRNGGMSSSAEGDALLATLARGHVDATLYGHIHDFIPFTNADMPAWISGGGAASNARLDDIGRHFLVVDADPMTRQVAVQRVDLGLP